MKKELRKELFDIIGEFFLDNKVPITTEIFENLMSKITLKYNILDFKKLRKGYFELTLERLYSNIEMIIEEEENTLEFCIKGFSGSYLFNTRYIDVEKQLKRWK